MFTLEDANNLENDTIEFLREELRAVQQRREYERDHGKPIGVNDLALVRFLFRLIAAKRKREAAALTEGERLAEQKSQAKHQAMLDALASSAGSAGANRSSSQLLNDTAPSKSVSAASAAAMTASGKIETNLVSKEAQLAAIERNTKTVLEKFPGDESTRRIIEEARQMARNSVMSGTYEHKKKGGGREVAAATK